MRGQQVVAYVLIVALTISAIALVYSWASPILNKATDKVNVEKCISYSEAIENAVERAAEGDTVDVRLKIPGFIYFKDDQIIVKCNSNTKLLPPFFVPLNYNQLPVQRENILCNATDSCGANCKNGTVEIHGVIYEFNITDGTTLCIDSCAKEGEKVRAGNEYFDVIYVNEDNNYSYILGDYVSVNGILGKDPKGIVVGKQIGDVEIRIVFWPLVDDYGVIHKIHLESNELSTNGNAVLHLSLDHSNQTDTYIKVDVI